MVKSLPIPTFTSNSDTDSSNSRRITKSRKNYKKKLVEQKPEEEILEIDDSTITNEDYIKKVHEIFREKNKKAPKAENRVEEYYMEKICENCLKPKDDDLLLLCDYCDDAYHTYCLSPKLKKVPEDEIWKCPVCIANDPLDEETRLNIGDINFEKESVGVNFANYNRPPPSSSSAKRQSLLDEHFMKKSDAVEKLCERCEEPISSEGLKKIGKNFEGEMICIKCNKYFHSKCFNSKKNAIICKTCEALIRATLPKSKETILDYFSQSSSQSPLTLTPPPPKFRKKSKKLIFSKQRKTFRLPSYASGALELKLKEQLLFALKVKNIEFCDDLRYPASFKENENISKNGDTAEGYSQKNCILCKIPPINEQTYILANSGRCLRSKRHLTNKTCQTKQCEHHNQVTVSESNNFKNLTNSFCSENDNNAEYEPNLQKMDKSTLKIFLQFKEQSRKANYVPVTIEQDKIQGFIVRAYDEIKEKTLICEYVGDVDFARNRIFDKNDSIMDLLRTGRSKCSLVICPEKYGNIARFLSGINNQDEKAKEKQNVQSIRFNVEGKARVILFAKRKILKGEILYYDYNEGGFDEYPTEEFV